jgi:molybdopterin-guanine dinucleotide biosynthesis protein A
LKNEKIHTEVCCVILSGGVSSRMNRHKALLRFAENENFLENIIAVYKRFGLEKIIVVANENLFDEISKKDEQVVFVKNNSPEKGRLFSLQLAFSEMTTPFCFVQNIDNPFVNYSILESIWEHRFDADYVTPTFQEKGGHPILMNEHVIEHLTLVSDYTKTLKDLLNNFSRKKIATTDASCLININTPEDYELYFPNNPTE